VIYPGSEGKSWGPVFRDALLEFEDQGLVRGDVELHVRPQGWLGQGPSKDPNYNGMVLHAALKVDSHSTGLHKGENVPVVSLAFLLEAPIGLMDESDLPFPRTGSFTDPRVSHHLRELLETQGYAHPATLTAAGELLDRAGTGNILNV
jgi:hypothetical protein